MCGTELCNVDFLLFAGPELEQTPRPGLGLAVVVNASGALQQQLGNFVVDRARPEAARSHPGSL
eukprot:6537640-Pyramimonas_sp.AAC.1